MKKWLLLLIPLVAVVGRGGDDLSLGQVMAARFGAQMKMRVSIVDDAGNPVPDANVKCLMTTGGRDWNVCEERTGTNGVCFVSGRTNGEEIRLRISKEGYYVSAKSFCFVPMHNFREVSFNRWQPYGEEVRICLRPFKNRRKMISNCRIDTRTAPRNEGWIGFDFEKRDFVRPYGTGAIADVEFLYKWGDVVEYGNADSSFKVRFHQRGSGYYIIDKTDYSAYTGPYEADTNQVYSQSIEYWSKIIRNADGEYKKCDHKYFDKSKELVVRVRCRFSSDGELLCANYARICQLLWGPEDEDRFSVSIVYDYNPQPNSTVLEPL